MNRKSIMVLALLAISLNSQLAAQTKGRLAGDILDSLLPQMAKQGESLAADKSALLARQLLSSHGKGAARFLDAGGLELLEVAGKHADEAFQLTRSSSPEAVMALTRNFDELLPLVREQGAELLELEARCPGMAGRIAPLVDEPKALKLIARNAPAEDLPKLASALERAESRETRDLIAKSYLECGQSFLSKIPSKLILSFGAVLAAYRIACGVGSSLPPLMDPIGEVIKQQGGKFGWAVNACLVLMTMGVMGRFGLFPWLLFRPNKNPDERGEGKSAPVVIGLSNRETAMMGEKEQPKPTR